ncbi:MAG TPA: ribose-phosphate diphosphokinase [Candidatus Binatia bacterium]|nr:ribose-phosphate diphosphokinase [Candidatus Binatia bacterium]
MTPLVLAAAGNDALAHGLARRLELEVGRTVLRTFPDGESYVRIETPVAGRAVVVACTLDRPDRKLLPLLLLAATARDLGATRVGLVAPYLAYLRQDRRFVEGEGVTSAYFARLVSAAFDWLVTVDPHLHRHAELAEIYAIPTVALPAAPLLAVWIRREAGDAVLVGPDAESRQWVGAVAADAGVPFVVVDKIRRGDRDVEVSVPDLDAWPGRRPVLVDDIISTGATMRAAVGRLARPGAAAPVCLGVHAVFAEGAHDALRAAGAARIVTTNTIVHPSNAIDVHDLVAGGVGRALDG